MQSFDDSQVHNTDAFDKNNINMYKQKICDLCLSMEKTDLVDILVFLKQQQQLPNKLFNQNCDGIKINLDLVPDNVIYNLYVYVIYKVSNGGQAEDADH